MRSTLAKPTVLPVFRDDVQGEEIVDGYYYLGSEYDGIEHVHIQPWRSAKVVNGVYYPEEIVGQDYWIGTTHLMSMIIKAMSPSV